MKKVLYIHQYFKTPDEPGGTRSYWFCRELLKNGIDVTMVTSRNKQKKVIEQTIIEGIKVIYIKNKYDNSFGIIRRFISFTRFVLICTLVSIKEKEIDLVFATSTPLTIGIPPLVLKWAKRKRFIFEVRDLWPEVPIQMGALKNKILINIAKKIEKRIYSKAEHLITLSPGMLEGVHKVGIPKSKISMIPNMAKTDKFFSRKIDQKLFDKLELKKNIFYAIHFGTFGIANGLSYIVDTAKILKQNSVNDIVFLFAGEGGQENKLKELVSKYELHNIIFIGNYNMEKMSEIVNFSDCSIVSFANLKILTTNSPNKLFDSLSAQKPIIVNSNGWTRTLVEENKCGAYVDPNSANELANLLIHWRNNPDILIEFGANARKLAENKYDKSILAPIFVNIIQRFI